MALLTALPADEYITAALDELVTDTQSLLDAAGEQKPIDQEELKFWRRQRNAYVNAAGDWADGLRPHLTPTGYILRSASHPGETHRAWQVGGIWTCSCRAGELGVFHRHTALISAIERAAELQTLDEQAREDVTGGGPEETPPAAAPEPWQIGRVIARQMLCARLEATEAYLETLRAEQQRLSLPAQPAKPLKVRLVEARKKSAYFASAFYLAA
jgi:hypothetical protein